MSAVAAAPPRMTPDRAPLTADMAARIAEEFIADHLGNLALAGVPRRMIFPVRAVWAVPIALAYPGYGFAGVIGVVAVDDEIAGVVAATPVDEMRAAAEQLYTEQRSNIEAAFQKVTSAAS